MRRRNCPISLDKCLYVSAWLSRHADDAVPPKVWAELMGEVVRELADRLGAEACAEAIECGEG